MSSMIKSAAKNSRKRISSKCKKILLAVCLFNFSRLLAMKFYVMYLVKYNHNLDELDISIGKK